MARRCPIGVYTKIKIKQSESWIFTIMSRARLRGSEVNELRFWRLRLIFAKCVALGNQK